MDIAEVVKLENGLNIIGGILLEDNAAISAAILEGLSDCRRIVRPVTSSWNNTGFVGPLSLRQRQGQ